MGEAEKGLCKDLCLTYDMHSTRGATGTLHVCAVCSIPIQMIMTQEINSPGVDVFELFHKGGVRPPPGGWLQCRSNTPPLHVSK